MTTPARLLDLAKPPAVPLRRYVVRSSGAARGNYRRVAVVEVDPLYFQPFQRVQLSRKRSMRQRGVLGLVRFWDKVHSKGVHTMFRVIWRAAMELALRLNKEENDARRKLDKRTVQHMSVPQVY